MKIKLFLMMIMMIFGMSSISYASFPVEKNTSNNTTIVKASEEEEITSPAIIVSGSNKTVALILALTLGLLAAHRWYMGNNPIINIFFIFTFGGLGIWLLIDIINIIRGKGPKGRLS